MKVGGMCWVISTGKRSITGPISVTSVISACGPPVEDPITSTRGVCVQKARAHVRRATGAGCGRGDGSRGRSCAGASGGARRSRGGAADLGAERADLLDQIVMKDVGGRRFAGGFRLRNVIRRAERKRLEADLRVAAGQGRRHDDDQVAFLRQQQGQRGNAVEFRHFDIEHGDIGIDRAPHRPVVRLG